MTEMTEKQRQLMMSMENFKQFIESGDCKRASVLISMAYLAHSVANSYNEEALEIMEKYDLVHKKIKTRATNLEVAFDLYDKAVFSLVDKDEMSRNLCEDYDKFRSICDDFIVNNTIEEETK